MTTLDRDGLRLREFLRRQQARCAWAPTVAEAAWALGWPRARVLAAIDAAGLCLVRRAA